MKIGFIGLGNMASAMIGGLLEKGGVSKENIVGFDVCEATRKSVKEKYEIGVMQSNTEVAAESDVLVLAVKPQYMEQAIESFKAEVSKNCVIISIAPGKKIGWLTETLGSAHKIVRCMPNTPALVGEGCTGFCVNDNVTDEEKLVVQRILKSFGKAIEVVEKNMDVVVGISGSSPAYVFIFIEAMADAAVAAGMSRKQAYDFAAQAVYGSAKLMLDTGKHPGELKDMVCSPAGTTIAAVQVLEEMGFRAAVMDAVEACIEKSTRL